VITFDIKKKPFLPSDMKELLSMIKAGSYDIVVSSGSSPMVCLLLFLSGVPIRVGYNTSFISSLLLTNPVTLKKDQYAGAMYHALAEGLVRRFSEKKSGNNDFIPQAIASRQSQEAMNEFLLTKDISDRLSLEPDKNRKQTLILFHPGTSRLAIEKGILKTWSAESWAELACLSNSWAKETKLPLKLILCGGPDDQSIIEEILAVTGEDDVISAYGWTKNLSDLAALIQLSDMMVCVDSAPMHLAVGLGKPLVALFGPTNPYLLLPDRQHFKFVWDNKSASRQMFDGLGVDIAASTVFNTIKELVDQDFLLAEKACRFNSAL
ncbi:MAG: glycosyltransferase family 9 protein, partial [Candidatus Obscuribacterales bacterium]|nr:glycosyltransferase family 9 protein [Candidatus Obscuribacterales bacterium]